MREANIENILPLTPLQHGFLFHALYDDGVQDSYVTQMVFSLDGALDPARLQAATRALLRRHASLRAAFVHHKVKAPVQVIQRAPQLPWQDLDLSAAPDPEAALKAEIARDYEQRFDLARAPLLRFTLIRMAPERHMLIFTSHHILMDGWSTPILLNELFTLYDRDAETSGLPHVTPWRDYVKWLAGRDDAAARAAWQDAFAGFEEPARIAPAASEGAVPQVMHHPIPDALIDRMQDRARELGVTMNTLAQAAWGLVLGHVTHRHDVAFGSIVSGRPADLPGVEHMIGLFINSIPVRMRWRPDMPASEVLRGLQDEQARLLDHQHLGLSEIQRSVGQGDLFDSLVVFENFPIGSPGKEDDDGIGGLRIERHSNHGGDTSHYAASIAILPGETYQVKLAWRGDLISDAMAEWLVQACLRALDALADPADRPVARIALTPPQELAALTAPWNDTAHPLRHETLADMLEGFSSGDGPALDVDGERLDRTALHARANRLAHELIARGIGPGDLVGVMMPRSARMVVAVMAVLKAGAAYLPLDPDYPAGRLTHMIGDAAPALVLTTPNVPCQSAAEGTPVLCLDRSRMAQIARRPAHAPTDAMRHRPLRPDDAAYVIYTSGSTGTPKGVVIPHRGIVNRLRWMQREYPLQPDDAILHKTAFGFDVSVWELLFPLVSGARLVVARPDGHRDPAYLAGLIRDRRVTMVHFVASMLEPFIDEPGTRDLPLRRVICGGEALGPDLLARARERLDCEINHSYGPTETSIGVAAHLCDSADQSGPVPVGGPVANTRFHVLDRELRCVPPGVTGELYIAGSSLARGYLNQPGLTADRFVANPFAPGERMYRSGDLAMWREDGKLVIRGRADQQVKIRGLRIELGEISAAMSAAGWSQNAVILREDQPGQRRIVAYVVRREGKAPDHQRLREELARRLPDHMVPAAFVTLDALPSLPNGKLDRSALPAPDTALAGAAAPRNAREHAVAALFAEVLALPAEAAAALSVADSFFTLGGHSLLAIRLISRLRSEMGLEISIRSLFENPTVEALARVLDKAGGVTPRPALRPMPRPRHLPQSFAQARLWTVTQLEGPSATYNMPMALRLSGPLEAAALRAALADITTRHEVLRTIFPNDDTPVQQVLPASDPAASPDFTLREITPEALAPALEAESAHVFDLSQDLPLHSVLFRLSGDEHVLLLVLHHIAGDGASLAPLAADLAEAYRAHLNGIAAILPPPTVQYADYALWQRDLLGDAADPDSLAARQAGFWAETLTGAPQQVTLLPDHPRPAVAAHRGARIPLGIDAAAHQALDALASRHGATMFMVLHAALAMTMQRSGCGDDIVIGTALAGRQDDLLQDMVGFFVNTLALRSRIDADRSMADLLDGVRDADLSAFDNQDLPFDQIVDRLVPDRSLAVNPLFQVFLVLQNAAPAALSLPGLSVELIDSGLDAAKFDLTLDLAESRDQAGRAAGIEGVLQYDADLYEPDTARRFAARFRCILHALARLSDQPLRDIPMADQDETALLRDFGKGAPVAGDLAGQDFFSLIQTAAGRNPTAPALDDGQQVVTFTDLIRRVEDCASGLLEHGVRPGSRVGVMRHRSADAIVAMLGIIRAGGVYLPLDPNYPQDRLDWIVSDARPVLILAEPATSGRLPAGDVPVLSDLPAASCALPPLPRLSDPAYVIYTSGSTGRPKGVVLTHAGLAGLVGGQREAFGITPDARVLQFASPSFDAAIAEIIVTLASGATLVLADSGDMAPGAPLADLVRRRRVTHATLPPVVLAAMQPADMPGLTHLITAGEALPPHLAAIWGEGRHLVNAYGPTENTVCATMSIQPFGGLSAPIGRPITGTDIHILDASLQPVPVGVGLRAGLGRHAGTASRAAPVHRGRHHDHRAATQHPRPRLPDGAGPGRGPDRRRRTGAGRTVAAQGPDAARRAGPRSQPRSRAPRCPPAVAGHPPSGHRRRLLAHPAARSGRGGRGPCGRAQTGSRSGAGLVARLGHRPARGRRRAAPRAALLAADDPRCRLARRPAGPRSGQL
nr:NRPS [Paracoccus alcaliphilus]